MDRDHFAEQVANVAALADPIRRDLYLFVAAQPGPVSRDGAAAGVGVPRHTAKFHLDRLVDEGLLATDYQRLSGRHGPGAGRPTKLYQRSARQVSVTLPERRYDLAGQLLAQAVDESAREGTPVLAALTAAATAWGDTVGDRARQAMGPRPGRERRLSTCCGALAAHGYEPRPEGNQITLINCPFDALARAHTELVCGMNLALLGGVAERAGEGMLTARLDPADSRCCVVLDIE